MAVATRHSCHPSGPSGGSLCAELSVAGVNCIFFSSSSTFNSYTPYKKTSNFICDPSTNIFLVPGQSLCLVLNQGNWANSLKAPDPSSNAVGRGHIG